MQQGHLPPMVKPKQALPYKQYSVVDTKNMEAWPGPNSPALDMTSCILSVAVSQHELVSTEAA